MFKIRNLINSPYQIRDKNGKQVWIPARGEAVADISVQQVSAITRIGFFKVTEVPAPASKKKPATKKTEETSSDKKTSWKKAPAKDDE